MSEHSDSTTTTSKRPVKSAAALVAAALFLIAAILASSVAPAAAAPRRSKGAHVSTPAPVASSVGGSVRGPIGSPEIGTPIAGELICESCPEPVPEQHTLKVYSNQVYSTTMKFSVEVNQGESDLNAGPFAAKRLVIEFPDGTRRAQSLDLFLLADEQRFSFQHTFDHADGDPLARTVVATLTDRSANASSVVIQNTLAPKYDVSWSSLYVKAIEDCDWFGKGDFSILWDSHDDAEAVIEKRRKLGQGDEVTIAEFAGARRGVEMPTNYTAGMPVFVERDFSITRFLQILFTEGLLSTLYPDGADEEPLGEGVHEIDEVVTAAVFHEGTNWGDNDCQVDHTYTITVELVREFRNG